MTERPLVLLSDANVLIDYLDSDPAILGLVSEHIGPVYVLREVLAEADGMTLAKCRELSITVHQLETEQFLEAVSVSTRLSYEDRLCFLACRDNGWVCVSNDKPLRTTCQDNGISVRWGLELMIELVHAGGISPARATRVAEKIRENNPLHITKAIIARFIARLSSS